MSGRRPEGRRDEAGYSLVTLMAGVAIMMIMLGAATPGWRYVMKSDAEEELIFRGGQIADGIQRYQRKNGNALPPSLDVLVKGRFLRKAYKDPMVPDGKWRFLRPGELAPGALPGVPGRPGVPGSGPPGTTPPGGAPGATPPGGIATTPGSNDPTSTGGGPLGSTIQGVASRSTDKSLRIFNGREHYNEWLFIPGQPRVVGRPMGPVLPILPGSPRPGVPTPSPISPPKAP